MNFLTNRTDAQIEADLGLLPDALTITSNGQSMNVFAHVGGETVHIVRLRADRDGVARDPHGNAVAVGFPRRPRRQTWGTVPVTVQGVFTRFDNDLPPPPWEKVTWRN